VDPTDLNQGSRVIVLEDCVVWIDLGHLLHDVQVLLIALLRGGLVAERKLQSPILPCITARSYRSAARVILRQPRLRDPTGLLVGLRGLHVSRARC